MKAAMLRRRLPAILSEFPGARDPSEKLRRPHKVFEAPNDLTNGASHFHSLSRELRRPAGSNADVGLCWVPAGKKPEIGMRLARQRVYLYERSVFQRKAHICKDLCQSPGGRA